MAWKRSGGGGYLNGVAFRINSITFDTQEFEGGRDGTYEKLSAVVNVTPDGGEAVDQYLDAGFMPDGATISKDKKTIDTDLDAPLRDNTEFIRFVSSAVENGFPEAELEDGGGKNFECMEGWRFIGAREKDREQQIRVGRARLKAKGKKNPTEDECFEAGKREVKKGEHKGKKFDLDVLLVSKTIGKDDGDEKPTGKPSQKASKPAKKAEVANDDDNDSPDTDRLDEVLRAVLLAEANGTLSRGKLQGAIVTWAAENDVEKAERTALKDAIYDEEYLNDAEERGIITYDSEGKNGGTITLKKGKKR
jgi:hypothetical protein